jgi:hypothetical protein
VVTTWNPVTPISVPRSNLRRGAARQRGSGLAHTRAGFGLVVAGGHGLGVEYHGAVPENGFSFFELVVAQKDEAGAARAWPGLTYLLGLLLQVSLPTTRLAAGVLGLVWKPYLCWSRDSLVREPHFCWLLVPEAAFRISGGLGSRTSVSLGRLTSVGLRQEPHFCWSRKPNFGWSREPHFCWSRSRESGAAFLSISEAAFRLVSGATCLSISEAAFRLVSGGSRISVGLGSRNVSVGFGSHIISVGLGSRISVSR